jgi:hypothetical protein
MLSNTLTGKLLLGKTNQENLSGWMSKRDSGQAALVFVNKSFETDYKTTLKVSGLKGLATVEVLTQENSGGLVGSDAMGKSHAATGPKSQQLELSDGSTLLVPKASIVTVRF